MYVALLNDIKLVLWNARGLSQIGIQSITSHYFNYDIIIITETWLTPATKLRTLWTQFHNYATESAGISGNMGITMLFHPDIAAHISPLPIVSPYFSSCTFRGHLIYGVYLPPQSSNFPRSDSYDILHSLPMANPHSTLIIPKKNLAS
jgi:hypothetical protein